VPNGHEEQLDRIRRKGAFWSFIWQVGDAAYYLGLLGSVILPLVVLLRRIVWFESWATLLREAGLASILFLGCFPAGLFVCWLLKWGSERFSGVD
jgi:hypothetical protein